MESVDRKSRGLAVIGTTIFFFVAPGTVAGFIPWWIGKGRFHPSFFGVTAIRAIGVILITASLVILLEAFVRFALKGIGTPAPVFPTKHLVVSGSYRYVRNPMYVAVVAMIFGQGLLFGRTSVLEWGLVFFLLTHLFVMFYEEPHLRRTFGSEYDAYRAAVHRWIPRLRPYSAGAPESP